MQAGEYASQSDKLTRTLADLRARRDELVAENGRVSVSDGVGTIRGGVASGVRMTDNSQQIEAIDTAIGQIESNYQEPLSRTPDEWRSEQAAAGEYLASGNERLVASLRNLGGAANEARLVSQASGGEIPLDQAINNRLGRGPSLATLTPVERAQQQADMTSANDTMTASMRDSIDEVFAPIEDAVSAQPLDYRAEHQAKVTRLRPSVEAAVFRSPTLEQALRGTSRERIGAQSLLSIAANQALNSNQDVGTIIDGLVADRSPATITAAGEFVNDEAFAGVKDAVRYQAVDRMMELMEMDGLNATQAKARALQEMQNSR